MGKQRQINAEAQGDIAANPIVHDAGAAHPIAQNSALGDGYSSFYLSSKGCSGDIVSVPRVTTPSPIGQAPLGLSMQSACQPSAHCPILAHNACLDAHPNMVPSARDHANMPNWRLHFSNPRGPSACSGKVPGEGSQGYSLDLAALVWHPTGADKPLVKQRKANRATSHWRCKTCGHRRSHDTPYIVGFSFCRPP